MSDSGESREDFEVELKKSIADKLAEMNDGVYDQADIEKATNEVLDEYREGRDGE